MTNTQNIRQTVDLSDLSLESISPQLIDKYHIPSDTAGAVITSSGDLEGGVISRMQSDSYELFVTSPNDITRGIEKMKSLGDDAALFRFNRQNDSYSWIKVRITG